MTALRRASTTPYRALLALLFLLACGLLRPGGAVRPGSTPLVALEIVDSDSGLRLEPHRHGGDDWIAGQPGRGYAIRLRNRSGARVLAVLSVDGINAIDGRTADPRQAGYVLDPWQTLEIAGWRKSLGTVARFVFDDPARSYAARTGRPHDIGVIGVAAFRERSTLRPLPAPGIAAQREASREPAHPAMDAAAPAAPTLSADTIRRARSMGADAGAEPGAGLGTGHGEIEGSPAYHTVFEREAVPSQVSEIRYDTREALMARGIVLAPLRDMDGHLPSHPRPRAFPGGFVPDPR